MDTICYIEIVKDNKDYVIRVYLPNENVKEYRHESFEEALTEMVVDLKEDFSD